MANDSFTEQQVIVRDSKVFPCPSCGGNMNFDPEKQTLDCPYCGGSMEIDGSTENIIEHDFEEGLSQCSSDWGSEVRLIHCDNCGAESILESNNTAQRCAFCDSSHVVNLDEVPGIRPESVIPFKVSDAMARQSFSQWLKGKFFVPKELKNNHKIDRMTGVYIPYWTYDADTHSVYKGEKGTYYYVTETYTTTEDGKSVTKTRTVQRTRWEPTSGVYGQFYNDELVHGSKQLSSLMLDELGTFNLEELVEYRPEYLSGFIAEKYSIGLKDCWLKAKESIKNKVRKGVIKQINGDTVRSLSINTTYDNITYKHILLPIWISAYSYKGKTYQFIINGQTGEIKGNAPNSTLKVIGTVLLSILGALVAIRILGAILQ